MAQTDWWVTGDAPVMAEDAASIASGKGASDVGVEDAGTLFTGTDTVETALAEVKTLADATKITADAATVRATLALTTGAGNAGAVGITDTATLYTATTVEAALAEVKTIADANAVSVAAGMTASKKTVVIGHADLTSAVNGEAQAINIGTALPANAVVFAHAITALTPFTGGTVSACVLDIGGTDADGIVKDLELVTDAATEAELNAARGLLPQGPYSAQQLTATFTPDGGNPLADLDAGSVTVTVWYFVLA